MGANNSNEFVGGGYRRSVDLCDDVIGVKPCFVAGAVPDHLVDENALRNAVLLRAFRFDGYDAEPDSGLAARAVFDDAVRDLHDPVHRECEAEAVCGNGLSVVIITCGDGLCGVDADNISVHVEQRASAVAGIDGCVYLDVAVDDAVHVDIAVNGAYDAEGCGEIELLPCGMAYRHDELADLYACRIPDGKGVEAAALDAENRNIRH